MMKTVLGREPHARFTLIYGNRALQSTMFKEEIEDLKNRYLTRLVLHHVFSDEHTDAPLNNGVMNRDKIGEFLRTLVPAQRIDHAFVCGPFQMNDEAEAALLAAGVPEERIHIERFGIAPQAAQAVGAVIHQAAAGRRRDREGHDHPRRAARARSSSARTSRASSTARRPPASKCRSRAPRACAAPAAPSWSKARCAWSATSRSTRTRSPPASC